MITPIMKVVDLNSIQSRLTVRTLTSSPSLLLAVSGIIFFLILIAYRIYFHPLAGIPGPFPAKITGQWRSVCYWKGTWHDDILRVHRQYGQVVRIAPNEVSVVDQHAMKLLYGHGHNALKTDWYGTWDSPVGPPSFFAIRDKKMHSFRRKRVSCAYSMSSVLKYEPYIQNCLDLLLRKLQKYALLGDIVDLSTWTSAFAFDVIGNLGYGAPLGHLQKEQDIMDVRKTIYTIFSFNACLGHYPGQSYLLTNSLTQSLLALFGEDKFTDFLRWTTQRILARKNAYRTGEKDDDGRSDLLNHFLNMKDANGKTVQLEEVIAEAGSLIGAGADTTSIAIRTCIQAIYSREEVLDRVRTEVDEAYTRIQASEEISYLQCQKLLYLNAVTKEAMRLLLSIVFQLLRYVPPPGLTVDGKFIPPDTPVGISPIAQNRDPAIWDTDADEFRAERWLDPDKAKYLDANDMTFGGNGPRMCVGRNIALVEVLKSVAQIVRHFDIEVVSKDNPWRITSYWFAYQHDFLVRIRLRSSHLLPE